MNKRRGFLFFIIFLVLLVEFAKAENLETFFENEELSGEYKLACGGYIKNCKNYKWWITMEAWFLDFNAITSCQFAGEEWNADMKLLYPRAHFDFNEIKMEIGVVPRKRSMEFFFAMPLGLRDLEINFGLFEEMDPSISFFVKETQPL